MEIRTQSQLSSKELRGEVPQIIAWLEARKVVEIEAMYGFGRAPMDLAWVPTSVALSDLRAFIAQSETKGLFEFAESDLWIKAGEVEFLLCHEADIHLVTTDLCFVEMVKSRWIASGWKGYERAGGESREWTEFP